MVIHMGLTKKDYDLLQDRFTAKLIRKSGLTRREDDFNRGVLACKSILKDEYIRAGATSSIEERCFENVERRECIHHEKSTTDT